MDHNEDIDKEIRISLSIFWDIALQGVNEVMRYLSNSFIYDKNKHLDEQSFGMSKHLIKCCIPFLGKFCPVPERHFLINYCNPSQVTHFHKYLTRIATYNPRTLMHAPVHVYTGK